MTGMEHAIEHAARTLFLSDRSDTLPAGFPERQWDEGHAVKDDYLRRARALAEAGLLAALPTPVNGCQCTGHSQDAGGGHVEFLMEYEPSCPEHSEHVWNPRTGVWEHADRAEDTNTGGMIRANLLGDDAKKVAAALIDRFCNPAPAVSRADIEKAILDNEYSVNDDGCLHHEVNISAATDAVCDLFGVEAEQTIDPVEEQTDALADILYGDELVTDHMRGVLERVVRSGMLHPEQEADHA